MKVLLINGSPHLNGCTATALEEMNQELQAVERRNRHRVARHRIAVGDEARRAEEPTVEGPKGFAPWEGHHNGRNILNINDFNHCCNADSRRDG